MQPPFFEEMLMNKCVPNDVTFNYLVNGFSKNGTRAISEKGNEFQENKQSMFLNFFGRMISDGWAPRSAAYNSILICLCQYGMFRTALQLSNKMTSKGCIPDSVSFVALLHGVCLEGRSKEWKNIVSCNLNERELQIAVNYSSILDQYLPQGTSEASVILQTMFEECQSHSKVGDNIQVSVS